MSELLGMMRSLGNDFRSQADLLIELKKDVEVILAAFPVGGLVEHRMFHEKQAIDYKSSRELKDSIVRNIAVWGIIGTFSVIIAALVLYAQAKLGFTPK